MDRTALLAVAADLGWPEITLGPVLSISDEAAWRSALVGAAGYLAATPPERLRLAAALAPALLRATEAARERLAAWEARPPRRAESPEALRTLLRETIGYYGDFAMLPAIIEAFARAPAPSGKCSSMTSLSSAWAGVCAAAARRRSARARRASAPAGSSLRAAPHATRPK
jgi:hypothetical protein